MVVKFHSCGLLKVLEEMIFKSLPWLAPQYKGDLFTCNQLHKSYAILLLTFENLEKDSLMNSNVFPSGVPNCGIAFSPSINRPLKL